MMDHVEQLEQHVDALLKLLESAKTKIAELTRANDALKEQVDRLAETNSLNEKLQSQVQQFASEIEGMTSKESKVRDRLKTILSRIDKIENELTAAGGVD